MVIALALCYIGIIHLDVFGHFYTKGKTLRVFLMSFILFIYIKYAHQISLFSQHQERKIEYLCGSDGMPSSSVKNGIKTSTEIYMKGPDSAILRVLHFWGEK